MSKNSRTRTDDGAFNALRFNKIDWKKEAELSRKALEKDRAEHLAALKAYIEADERKLKAAKKTEATESEPVKFSGIPEFEHYAMKTYNL